MNRKVIPIASANSAASPLEAKLRNELEGEVLFDAFSRGRYATDASIYQVMPIGVVVPTSPEDALRALQIAADARVPILPRGAGSSQCGQTVGEALIIDNSKHLNRILDFDKEHALISVQPGVVLDQLNAWLRPHGLWFPVDVSTSAQATLGGMTGNNSCGSRSIAYGNMVHNVLAIDAWLPTNEHARFGPLHAMTTGRAAQIAKWCRALFEREREEIEARFPKVPRKVAGYNLDHLGPPHANAAHLLVGSEGTLAYFERITLKLAPLPKARVLGVCHFPSFYQAMDVTRHIVTLAPTAVELVDRTMIGLARDNPAFRAVVERFIVGEPDAILLVEFAGDSREPLLRQLKALATLLSDHGFPGCVVEITDATLQKQIWDVRKAGLNIMMSMKGDGKPVSFIEDCCVPLEHLAEYTRRLTEVFEKHGTRGTWYAHASVGTLHVRPILDMRRDGARKMRAIAEEASALVREYKGAYSGEHGDGLVRSEWIAPFFGARLTAVLTEIKSWLDPVNLMNPGKIVNAPRMDEARLFRFPPGYTSLPIATTLEWSEFGGFDKAVEMCNNNGHCRKFDADTMCPSYRVTMDEIHSTRGRANTLRLALSGALGKEALTSDELREAMDLCVGCKGCKRECPTGVDMAKMKIEFLHQYHARHGYTLRDRLIAYLPRYAPYATHLRGMLNSRNKVSALARLSERWLGLSARRRLPQWRADTFVGSPEAIEIASGGQQVVLFADTFNNYFEPENLHAAKHVLEAAGCSVRTALAGTGERPLCCGRTFLAAGMVAEARAEARRLLNVLVPYAERALPIIGLEPSCLLTLRDEYLSLDLGAQAQLVARHALLFEEFLAREHERGALGISLQPLGTKRALLHGHCHQKAHAAMPAIERVLRLIPELSVDTIAASCCGMAGAFGYDARHYDVSMKMAEASLLPAVRAADTQALIVADGVSCRHQIHDGSGRQALHVARVLDLALARPTQ